MGWIRAVREAIFDVVMDEIDTRPPGDHEFIRQVEIPLSEYIGLKCPHFQVATYCAGASGNVEVVALFERVGLLDFRADDSRESQTFSAKPKVEFRPSTVSEAHMVRP